MPPILGIIQHTPLWVFALLALLVVLGIQALRPRTIAVWRLLIVPVVFIVWGIFSVLERAAISPVLLVEWLATWIAGVATGWLTTRLDGVQIDRTVQRVRMPGSPVPLLRNVVIFLAKYCLAVAMIIVPAQRATLAYWDIAISGIAAGYFIGWLVRFACKYFIDRRLEATPSGRGSQ